MNYIIGCGGVGSAIAPSFCLLKSPGDVTLIDGDAFERKNLNRQLFDAGQIGLNKAQALAGKCGCRFLPEWFARGKISHGRNDWLICLVDNHRTRLETLEVFRLGAGDLSELIQNAVEAGEGIDGIVDLVAEKIDEDAWSQCEPDLDSDGEYDYDDHDATGSENGETSYSKGDIRDAVLAFVRERHPELAAEL